MATVAMSNQLLYGNVLIIRLERVPVNTNNLETFYVVNIKEKGTKIKKMKV